MPKLGVTLFLTGTHYHILLYIEREFVDQSEASILSGILIGWSVYYLSRIVNSLNTSRGQGDGTAGRGGLPMDWFFAAYGACGLMFYCLCRLWIEFLPPMPPTDGPPETSSLKDYLCKFIKYNFFLNKTKGLKLHRETIPTTPSWLD